MYHVSMTTTLAAGSEESGLPPGTRLFPSLDSARSWSNWIVKLDAKATVVGILSVYVAELPIYYCGVEDERIGPEYRTVGPILPNRVKFLETLAHDAAGLPVVTQVPE